MRWWWGHAVGLLGIAAALASWWFYRGLPDGCSAHALYGDWYLGTGELRPHCDSRERELYAALAVLAASPVLFALGWMQAIAVHAHRITTRVQPRALAAGLLVVLVTIAGVGVVGWQRYADGRERDRLQRAEATLARLTIPATLYAPPPSFHCERSADIRCFYSDDDPAALRQELVALLDGTVSGACDRSGSASPCSLWVTGKIAGYPAQASAVRTIYDRRTDVVPSGATRLRVGKQVSPYYYAFGSTVQISLLTPEQ